MFDAEVIKNAHVLVVGCGALGNEVLKNLVLMGVRHLVIVDFDYVEQGNLTRSVLFRRRDVGERKVDVAKRALTDLNPELDIHTIHGDIAYDVGLGLVRRMDIVLGCVDNRWARYCIQRLCHRAGKTWVDGGILDLTGTVKVFRQGVSCYACSLSTEALADMHRRMPCSGVIRRREATGHAPTTSIIASIIGGVMAQEAIKNLASETKKPETPETPGHPESNKLFSYDGDTMTVLTPIYEAWDEDCALHGEWNIDSGFWLNVDAAVREEKVGDILQRLSCDHIPSRIVLNVPFVDWIENRRTEQKIQVMLPANWVEDFILHDPKLSGCMMSDFCQHEFWEIDDTFPYPDITLCELGVPEDEILRLK